MKNIAESISSVESFLSVTYPADIVFYRLIFLLFSAEKLFFYSSRISLECH